jgi:hypothetical protein
MDEVVDKVTALREELRNGRRASQTGSTHVENTGDRNAESGSVLQIVPGSRGQDSSQGSSNGSAGRSVEEKSLRERSADRRLSESNSRANDPLSGTTAANARSAGRLVAEDPIPSRLPEPQVIEEKRGRGRPPKEPDAQPVKIPHPGKVGSALSKKEVEDLKEPLMAALRDDCQYLDEFLWWYSKDPEKPQIWSDLDDEEIEVLTRMLLRRGERSPVAANAVRNIVDGADYISTAVIMVPRMIKTMQQTTKRPPRVKREKSA